MTEALKWSDDIDALGIRHDDGSWLLHAGYDDARVFEIITTNIKTKAVFHDYIIGSIDGDTAQVVDYNGTDIGVAFDDVSRWMPWNPDRIEKLEKQLKEYQTGEYTFETSDQEKKLTRILEADSDDTCRDDFETLVAFTKDLMLCNRISAGCFAKHIVKISDLENKIIDLQMAGIIRLGDLEKQLSIANKRFEWLMNEPDKVDEISNAISCCHSCGEFYTVELHIDEMGEYCLGCIDGGCLDE